jgi:hypothetical protein
MPCRARAEDQRPAVPACSHRSEAGRGSFLRTMKLWPRKGGGGGEAFRGPGGGCGFNIGPVLRRTVWPDRPARRARELAAGFLVDGLRP